jgi:hypothetical protein
MAYTPKDLSGALFKNDKGDNAARPDYRGDAMVNGELMEIAAWIKPLPSDASKRYMSLSFKPKQQRQEEPRQAPSHDGFKVRQLAPSRDRYGGAPGKSEGMANDGFDSDIPF